MAPGVGVPELALQRGIGVENTLQLPKESMQLLVVDRATGIDAAEHLDAFALQLIKIKATQLTGRKDSLCRLH